MNEKVFEYCNYRIEERLSMYSLQKIIQKEDKPEMQLNSVQVGMFECWCDVSTQYIKELNKKLF